MPSCHQNEYCFSCNHLLFSQWTSDYVKSNESLFPKYYFIPLYINKWDGIGIRLLEEHREDLKKELTQKKEPRGHDCHRGSD